MDIKIRKKIRQLYKKQFLEILKPKKNKNICINV
jgi:hypothetical protein